nr:hypothetical protein [Spirochaetia bacterium]
TTEDIAGWSSEDHERYFTSFLGSLYNSFLDFLTVSRKKPDIFRQISYKTRTLNISNDQLPELKEELDKLLLKYQHEAEIKGTAVPYYLSTIFLPEINYESKS